MAKMGFSAQTTPFRASSFCPPYFRFCRSCTQFYSFSSSSRVSCRLEDRAAQSANGLLSDRILSSDSLELNQRSSYSTYQHNESQMLYRRRNNFASSQWEKPLVYRKVERRAEDNREVSYGLHPPGHTAEAWGRATEECKQNKKLFAYRNNASANLKTLTEEDVAGKAKSGRRNIYEGEGSRLRRAEKEYTRNGGEHGLRVSHNQMSLVQAGCSTMSHKNDADNKIVLDSCSVKKGVLPMDWKIRDEKVANIDVKEETPVDHGEIICFSIYSGPEADFGDGKSCIWVDVLDAGGKDLLKEFAPFFEDSSIRKVWHNYSFDNHVIENYGLKLSGFYADTMHMARLWNSSRRTEGGYSLEALTGDSQIMSDANRGPGEKVIGKVSMKNIFGRKKLKKDGSEGKLITIPPVEELQRAERKLWICYSALDSKHIEALRKFGEETKENPWAVDGHHKGSMFDNYVKYLQPFGELLVKMETEGMLVDRLYLAEIEKVAKAEQQVAADRFRKWASKYCPDAKYMNVGSDAQLRQLFFGGVQNSKDQNEFLPVEKDFKVPNVDNIIEEGKKSATKYRKIILRKPDGVNIETDKYTASGWPSVSGDVLKSLAGKVSADFDFLDEDNDEELPENVTYKSSDNNTAGLGIDTSAYGAAYSAFGGGQAGIEACHAIAALCEVCSIDSLISNFILPLQGNHISGKNGRIHCSLNINTETGRLSARRPNLQNQPALEKDRYKIRQAFIAAPGNSLIVADYGQLELRILAHLANCKSMLDAFKAGGDFHSRTAMNIRKAKMLNFSIAYGKTTVGLARDWKVSREEAQETVDRWYSDRQEVLSWQEQRKKQARKYRCVFTLLGRARHFPSLKNASSAHRAHIDRAAINTPVQGSAADVAMCAMLQISKNARLKKLGWRLLLQLSQPKLLACMTQKRQESTDDSCVVFKQVHDEVILEGPTESAEEAKAIVVDCMEKPFDGKNFLRVDLAVDAKCAQNWFLDFGVVGVMMAVSIGPLAVYKSAVLIEQQQCLISKILLFEFQLPSTFVR
ncbi:DNA polymerase I A, chloroplastic/mitochondrial [Sesamum angolense]|uniref:DNA polymerase I A, chloroplastic/mitochondrial n=1 Tax=Sesamum angolense TaxID=2727404 RepID=A0AAE1T968_9LAMI|nr:DNA polymerase I A, chloroplastic/mitochondrial [Sesamum angolense]